MIDSIFDLCDNVPNPVPAGSIPYYDGCNWIIVQMPEGGFDSCNDVQLCIDQAYVMSILNVDNSLSIVGGILSVSETWVNSIITVIWNAPNLTVGDTVVDLTTLLSVFSLTFNDGANSFSVSHNDQVVVEGLDGLRFLATAPNRLQVGLPTGPADMQVLTRDAAQGVAYWDNNQCCAQTLSFDTDTNVLCISGTNCVDLTSINTDNQAISFDAATDLLSITQLGAADQVISLAGVNQHSLVLPGPGHNTLEIHDQTGLIGSVDLINSGPHDLTFDNITNTLFLRNDNGDIMSQVVLDGVNNQTLEIEQVGDQCQNGWIRIGVTNSDGAGTTSRVDVPKAPVQCCADVMACSGVLAMLSDIANLFNLAASLQTQITAVQQQIP